MKTSHNVIESSKNPKRKLTGEAAISEGGNDWFEEKALISIKLSEFREQKHDGGSVARFHRRERDKKQKEKEATGEEP